MRIDVKDYLNVSFGVEKGEIVKMIKVNPIGDWREGTERTTTRVERFPEYLQADYNLGKLIGYYFANGNNLYSNEDGLGRYVRFNVTHYLYGKENINFIMNYLSSVGIEGTVKTHEDSTQSVDAYNGLLATALRAFVMHRYKGENRIAVGLTAISTEFTKGMLAGVIYSGAYKVKGDWLTVHLIGEELVMQTEEWLMQFGVEYRLEEINSDMGYYDFEFLNSSKELHEVLNG